MDFQALIDYINQYTPLNSEEEKLLISFTNYRKYLKGQYIVQQVDICRFESFVVAGCVRTFHVDQEGQEHIVMFAIDGWWTGDLGSFITQLPADYNVQCIENTEVIQFSYDQLQQLYLAIPSMERFFRIIIQKAFVATQKRIVSNFSLSAKERYLQFKQQYPLIEQRVPQYMVASYLGITKEFLSKIRKQLIVE